MLLNKGKGSCNMPRKIIKKCAYRMPVQLIKDLQKAGYPT